MTLSGQAYRETIGGYDKNGNIGSLHQMNNLGNSIADFDLYQVEAHGNQLNRIISNEKQIRSYDYDKIGRMTYENNREGERFVGYDVSGKVIGVYRQKEEDGTLKSPMATFGYDDRGFRLFKTAFNNEGVKAKTTWYVRDAAGNIVGTYEEEETGWNHFELREYDAEIGRWLVPDPMRENWSPYVAMGNNPINIVDPDGGCEKCPKDGITGHVGDITKILGKDYIWDGNDWLPISREVVMEASKPTMNELFDRFVPAPSDAVTYVITPPKGKLFRNYSKGLLCLFFRWGRRRLRN